MKILLDTCTLSLQTFVQNWIMTRFQPSRKSHNLNSSRLQSMNQGILYNHSLWLIHSRERVSNSRAKNIIEKHLNLRHNNPFSFSENTNQTKFKHQGFFWKLCWEVWKIKSLKQNCFGSNSTQETSISFSLWNR